MLESRNEIYEAVLESIHDRSKWETFRKRYFLELDAIPETVERLFDKGVIGRLTLLFSARDVECNQAIALKEYLEEKQRIRIQKKQR